jgi:hypothetical protein
MAVARKQDQSVLASLSELREIEEQRVADERAAERAVALAQIAAREAEAAARADAIAAQRRAEHEATLAVEHARLAAEREARLRIEATEAAERTRQQAILAESRLAQELELRRAEVARKRPTWMVAVTAAATLAAFVLIYVAIDRTKASEDARQRERVAVQQKRDMKHQLEELSASLASLQGDLDALSTKTLAALDDLAKAKGREAEAAAAAKVKRLDDEARALKAKRDKLREERERIENTPKPVKIDPKCLTQSIC